MSKPRQRALVRGRRADFWYYERDCFYLRHPGGHERTDVPVAHLIDDAMMWEHYQRLSSKNWVPAAAIDELREIAMGVGQ